MFASVSSCRVTPSMTTDLPCHNEVGGVISCTDTVSLARSISSTAKSGRCSAPPAATSDAPWNRKGSAARPAPHSTVSGASAPPPLHSVAHQSPRDQRSNVEEHSADDGAIYDQQWIPILRVSLNQPPSPYCEADRNGPPKHRRRRRHDRDGNGHNRNRGERARDDVQRGADMPLYGLSHSAFMVETLRTAPG